MPEGKGLGLACGSYLSGAGSADLLERHAALGRAAEARPQRSRDDLLRVSTDIGQGSDSILGYVVGEVLGIDPLEMKVVTADTDLTPVDLGSYSSPRDGDVGQCRAAGGRARTRADHRAGRREARGPEERASASPVGGCSTWKRSGHGDDIRRGRSSAPRRSTAPWASVGSVTGRRGRRRVTRAAGSGRARRTAIRRA